MRKLTFWLVSGSLALLLVASNACWLYAALDQASVEKYSEQMLHERLEALRAAVTVMPELAVDLDREDVIQRAARALEGQRPFVKDGVTVVGWLNFRFDAEGRLVEVGSSFPIWD